MRICRRRSAATWRAYCRHYVAYGKAEGRNGSADGQPVAAVQQADSQAQQTDSQTGTQNNGTAQSSAPAQSTQQASGTVIGTCTTSYVDNIPRATNVALAAQRINGTVVQPGGSFSFSNTILPRTSANGYVTAPIYVSGKRAPAPAAVCARYRPHCMRRWYMRDFRQRSAMHIPFR